MTEATILLLRHTLFHMTTSATAVKSILLGAGPAVATVTVGTSSGADPVMMAGFAILDLLYMDIVGKVDTRHGRTAEP